MAVSAHRVFFNACLAVGLLWLIGSGLLGKALHHLVTRVLWQRMEAVVYIFVFENFRLCVACVAALLWFRYRRPRVTP